MTRLLTLSRPPVFWFEVASGLRLLESDYRRMGKEAWAVRIGQARNALLREIIEGEDQVYVQAHLPDAS